MILLSTIREVGAAEIEFDHVKIADAIARVFS
jgi:hypothetical protein